MWRAECLVNDRVLWATGSAIGGLAGGVVWERVRDATGWSVGVGCTIGVYEVGCVAVLGALGDGCVARRRSIHLFLSIAGEGSSLAVGEGT